MLYRAIAVAAALAVLYRCVSGFVGRARKIPPSPQETHKMRRCSACGTHVLPSAGNAGSGEFKCEKCAAAGRA